MLLKLGLCLVAILGLTGVIPFVFGVIAACAVLFISSVDKW